MARPRTQLSEAQAAAVSELRDAQQEVDWAVARRDAIAARAIQLRTPWREIASAVGITPQSAHTRYAADNTPDEEHSPMSTTEPMPINRSGLALRDHLHARFGGRRFHGSVQYRDVDRQGNSVRADMSDRIEITARYLDTRGRWNFLVDTMRETEGCLSVSVDDAASVTAVFARNVER